MQADLRELRERVRAATGPNYALEVAIARAFDPTGVDVPNVTASLDAALALARKLLPDHYGLQVGRVAYDPKIPWPAEPRWYACIWDVGPTFDDDRIHKAKHDEPALAVLDALLSALFAKEQDHG